MDNAIRRASGADSMKPLLGPLEIRRRLILEKKGRRERIQDWIQSKFQKSEAVRVSKSGSLSKRVRIVWNQFTPERK